jgi:type III restriction enzyme
MLLFIEPANDAVNRIYHAIVKAAPGTHRGSSRFSIRMTRKARPSMWTSTRRANVYQTHFQKCHINYVTLDSDWEAVLAERIETMPEVVRYVKNQGLGFTIPYTLNGVQHQYIAGLHPVHRRRPRRRTTCSTW